MDKVIITATTAQSWIYPDLRNWPTSPQELVEEAVRCAEAGAAILHIHLPRSDEARRVVEAVRQRTDAIIQAGMSSYPIEERETDFEARPDLVSIILNHHDEHFPGVRVSRLHTLEEFEAYHVKCRQYRIKPEWEVWHDGSYWNLRHLVERGWFAGPHLLTLFFGWPGGTWSPPTPESYLYRLRNMPPECLHSVSVMGKEQTALAVLALSMGGNVRVGTEDYPFLAEGVPAKNNAELVERMVRIARSMGREIASPAEARRLLGI